MASPITHLEHAYGACFAHLFAKHLLRNPSFVGGAWDQARRDLSEVEDALAEAREAACTIVLNQAEQAPPAFTFSSCTGDQAAAAESLGITLTPQEPTNAAYAGPWIEHVREDVYMGRWGEWAGPYRATEEEAEHDIAILERGIQALPPRGFIPGDPDLGAWLHAGKVVGNEEHSKPEISAAVRAELEAMMAAAVSSLSLNNPR